MEPHVQVRRVQFETGVPLLPAVDEVVVAMGAPAMETLQKIGLLPGPKNRSLTSFRETAVAYKVMGVAEGPAEYLLGYGHWMFSYSPNSAFVEADKRSQIAWDARLAHRFYTTHSLEPPLGTYAYTDTLEYVIAYVEQKFAETGKAVSVALDLETMGLIPWYEDKHIVTVQLSVEPGVADVVYMLDDIWKDKARLQKLLTQLRWIMTSPKVALCGANLKFDIIWTWVKWNLRPTNFKMDTLLVGSLLDENRSNSLKQHAKEHTAMGGYELPLEKWFKENKLDKGQMHKVPKDRLLYYAGPDTDATIRVSIHQRKQLQQEKRLQRFYVKLLHPAVRAFEAIEHRGLVADLDEFGKLDKEISANIKELETACIKMMPARLRNKYAGTGDMLRAVVLKDFFFSDMGMNLKPILFTEKTGAIKTDKGHFMLFRDHPEAGPFIKLYTELNSSKKMLSTYVHGFLNHLRPDGRFHPTYMLFNGSAFEGKDDDGGTDTGRTSAVDPAVQCMVGETMVLTDKGEKRLDWLVENEGAGLKVLTHTGKWQPIVGVYRNGRKAVFHIATEAGKAIVCTGNHPILTKRGWVRADQLETTDVCYVARPQDPRKDQPDLPFVGVDEGTLPVSDQPGLGAVRGSRDNGVRPLAGLQEVPAGHGGEARYRLVDRAPGQRQGLRAGELRVGETPAAGREPVQHEADNPRGQDPDGSSLGEGGGDQQRPPALQVGEPWDADGASLEEGMPAEASCFEESCIAFIVAEDGFRETFDLTIQSSHSFVANGVVVHNTIPKHTKWAKRLRKAYPAPPGYRFFQADFSQGELRLAADAAEEPNMIEAYQSGKDLHCVTGAQLAGLEFEEFMAHDIAKNMQTTPAAIMAAELFAKFRQRAKPANFGLLYGMQAEGFRVFALMASDGKMDLTLEEATAVRDAFFSLYARLLEWHGESIAFAKEHGYIENPLGRIAHLPLIKSKVWKVSSKQERKAINSPIQSTLSDLCAWAISFLEERYADDGLWIAGMTHDSIYGYYPEDKQWLLAEIKGTMETLPYREVFDWHPVLDFPADIEDGTNLADLQKFQFSA